LRHAAGRTAGAWGSKRFNVDACVSLAELRLGKRNVRAGALTLLLRDT
jgi:hypothetical protein